MKKQHDPPPVRDRPPAMFVGDEEPPPPSISAQALVAGTPAAAMLPEDLRVTAEGTVGDRLPLMVFALLAMLFGGLGVVKGLEMSVFSIIMAALYAFIAAGCASLAWGERRVLMRGRKEYHLEEDGIVMSVLYGADPTPAVSRIRWTEIVDYQVSMDGETLQLRVDGTGGSTISLRDSPPRLSTRELIRRFIVEAERHPRALRPEKTSIGEIVVSFGFPIIFVTGAIAEATLNTSELQRDIGFYVILVVAFGLYLWHTVDDDDVARGDRTSRRAIARLRRWLRRVLNIPVT